MTNAMIAAVDLFTWHLPENDAVEDEFLAFGGKSTFHRICGPRGGFRAESCYGSLQTAGVPRRKMRFAQERILRQSDQLMKPFCGDIQKVSPPVLE
jgi:hypothetical protein